MHKIRGRTAVVLGGLGWIVAAAICVLWAVRCGRVPAGRESSAGEKERADHVEWYEDVVLLKGWQPSGRLKLDKPKDGAYEFVYHAGQLQGVYVLLPERRPVWASCVFLGKFLSPYGAGSLLVFTDNATPHYGQNVVQADNDQVVVEFGPDQAVIRYGVLGERDGALAQSVAEFSYLSTGLPGEVDITQDELSIYTIRRRRFAYDDEGRLRLWVSWYKGGRVVARLFPAQDPMSSLAAYMPGLEIHGPAGDVLAERMPNGLYKITEPNETEVGVERITEELPEEFLAYIKDLPVPGEEGGVGP